VLHQTGSRESATLEPFFTLPLDIQSEKVWNVKDALDGFVSRESLQGFTCSKTKVEVEATRRIMLEVLPPVLILHLKCFIYDKDGGIQKVIKKIDYNIDLEVSKGEYCFETTNAGSEYY
jgi:ubiquitin carboxyl-terminal hydrolase 10